MSRTRLASRLLLPLSLAMTAALACNLLAGGSQPTATPEEPPTAVRPPLSAADLLEEIVPSTVGGVEVTVVSIKGDEFDPGDPVLAELVYSLGVDPSEIEIAVAAASNESGMVFQAGAIRLPGRDWAAVLEALAGAEAGVTWEWVEVGGREVLQAVGEPDSIPAIYALAGDMLFYMQSEDEAVTEGVVEGLPEGSGAGQAPPSELPPPGTGPLAVVVLTRPIAPVCVAEPPGRQQLMVIALDAGLGVPSPHNTFTLTAQAMETAPTMPQFGPAAIYPYAATRYAGGIEYIEVQARALLGGVGLGVLSFQVQHCLQGTWQDGDRVVRITPPFSASITADIISGTSCGEEGGVDFTGVLDGDRLTGSDLKVCNPEECVEAGFLPLSTTVPYTGVVAEDGMSIAIDWTGAFYTWEEDTQGNLLSCNQTSTEEHSFTVERLTFGE